MRFSVSLSVALLLSFPLAQAREKKEPNPTLASIHKLFIKGNNEAATEARKRVLNSDGMITRPSCFGLVGNEAIADGILEISKDTAPDGTVIASGNLMDHQGNLLWSDSERGSTAILGPDWNPANAAAGLLMAGLEKEICGIPPLIKLSKVRKIHVVSPEDFKNVTWKSDCLTFVKRPVDADALLMVRIGGQAPVLYDPWNNDDIPGWEWEPSKGIADLERAVGCP